MCDVASNETTATSSSNSSSSATSLAYALCAHRLAWDDDAASCAERGGGLATVRSPFRRRARTPARTATYGDGAKSVWLGGSDAPDGGVVLVVVYYGHPHPHNW